MNITTFNRPKGTLEDTVALVRSRATTQPDIIAVQECRKPRADAHDHAWNTHHQHKGVGVAVRPDWSVTHGPTLTSISANTFIVDAAGTSLHILNVWAHHDPKSYFVGVLNALTEARPFLRSGTAIVLGDFNAHPCFGDAFFQITNTLRDDYGLVSAYHHVHGIAHGKEPHPTYYHQRKADQPFHIDYCFMSPTLLKGARVNVGTYDDWSADSDHRPLSVVTA